MSAGSRRDHDTFCRTEGWIEVSNARGGSVSHHLTYELLLDDGRILRTRISRPANNTTYGPSLWSTILRDQLLVTEAEFWACVRERDLPPRGGASEIPSRALPAELVHQLIHVARVPEVEVAQMDLTQAIARMSAYWSQPQQP